MTKTHNNTQIALRENVALAAYSTMQVGGAARYFSTVTTVEELKSALQFAEENSFPIFILGGGSNVLFPDDGLRGLVIYVQIKGIETNDELLTVGAGEEWDQFVAHTVAQNLAGVECLSGIPGSVGATPIQNVGAYGQEVADTITRVFTIDRTTHEPHEFTAAECEFAYRMSRFKGADKDRYVVTAVEFKLTSSATPTLRYGELSKYVEATYGTSPTLQQVREAVLTIRSRKAMVVDSAEPNSRSCGSFFTNPILPADELPQIYERALSMGFIKPEEQLPAFPSGNDEVKISAAWLIEHSGIQKGMRHGNAGISEKHVLALVNANGATQRELLELKAIVQEKVQHAFGIQLEPEPIIL